MKPRENYRITAVRVVEFHNLGTTTIEIPEGGHLFLLGDNGSGKTTILDAIHLVLTAGREMEFNSAARVAGAKDSGGRTIQGIVLRYNAVTGRPMRETGITYAAVELKSDTGRAVSLAVGLAADGMDVAFERWGGIASVPVADFPLAVEEGGRLRAATQTEFKRGITALTGGKYYGHINDYADAVGARLFGGEAKYADVCKLLRTAKAYREIAARAANYDDLFRKLLEEPSRDTFEPLLKGLRELEESKGRLEQIDERAAYLNELRRESERLEKLRFHADLVGWAEADAKRTVAEREGATIAESEQAAQKELASLEGEWAALKDDVARARERLSDLRAKDKTGLVGQEKAAAQRLSEAERKLSDAERVLAEDRRSAQEAEKAAKSACEHRASAFRKQADDLMSAGKTANFSAGGIADALYGADARDLTELFAEARARATVEINVRSDAAFHARAEAEVAQRETEERRKELDAIRARGENLPDVPGFAEAREELRAKMLGARPLYELLEPASGCDARHLAFLERLVGDDFLATWVVRPDEADQVRRIAWNSAACAARPPYQVNPKHQAYQTVAVRGESDDVSVNDLAPWLGTFVSFEESDVEAVRLLARHLAAKVGPKDGDFLSQKTWLFRGREGLLAAAKPRLIGSKARAAEQARLEKAAEVRLAEAERQEKVTLKKSATCEQSLAALQTFMTRLEDVRDVSVRETSAVNAAEAELRRIADRASISETRTEEHRRAVTVCRDELEDVRVKMRAEGIDGSLEKRIASAEKTVRDKERAADVARERIGGVRGRIEGLAKARSAREAETAEAAARASDMLSRFVVRIPEGQDVARFAAEEFPQLAVEGADYSALREGLAKESGAAEAKIEQRIRDQKGEAYAFSFDRAANSITDRRGSALAEVLADERRRVEELRGVLDKKSREVFEQIFMGEVMRRLYLDLMRITDLTGRIQRQLAGRKFGSNRYAFSISPIPEYEGFVRLVRKGYALDSGGEKDELRDYLELHRDEILNADIDTVPDIFDYRKWFRFELKVVTENEEGRVIDRKVKSMGSGGEQAVPNYLLILTVAEFLFHGGDGVEPPKTALLLFDEAFYGIDAARRDQLLAFADALGLQLFVSSPDQDGVKREIRHSVSLIVVKDENLDVHLTPVVWRNVATQGDLLGGDAPEVGPPANFQCNTRCIVNAGSAFL
ncbi:MAG: hypothetical protein IJQ00_00795 [Kiritimatiellae bacterium]|nr:hypothetical protein [Kiritimatiellia bacterium]